MNEIYFDNAATTPLDPEVNKAMEPFYSKYCGNPSSIHSTGQASAEAIKRAREKVADLLGAEKSEEIIFTSGGTEADNLAIKGVAMALKNKGNHIITSAIEHHAVIRTCQFLEKYMDFDLTYLPVDKDGFIKIEDLKNEIRSDTILISIMMANNETGTIEPIAKIGEIAHKHNIYFHSDAVQAVAQIPIDVQNLNIDLLSLSAHKFNGPKGVGALYKREGVKLIPQISGGAQENKRRAGTENVPGIVGLGKAAEIASVKLNKKRQKLSKLRDKIIAGIEKNINHVILNGPRGEKRLPGNVSFCFQYIEGESILLNLDMKGIAASSGSACTSDSLDPSHVLLALGLPREVAHGSLRISLGKDNTEQEVNYLLETLPQIVKKLRTMSPLYN